MKEDDFTKKPELMMVVAKLIPVFTQEDVLVSVYTLLLYLFKNNFDDRKLEVETAEDVINFSAELLSKQNKLSPAVLSYVFLTLGVIAGQAMINLELSEDLMKAVEESRVLFYVASRVSCESMCASLLECISKFIHPIRTQKDEYVPNHQLKETFSKLKSQVGLALSSKVQDFPLLTSVLSGNQLDHFFYVVYECLKCSEELKTKVISNKANLFSLF